MTTIDGDIDPVGLVAHADGTVAANGWKKGDTWYGEDVGGDSAVSWGYLATYERKLPLAYAERTGEVSECYDDYYYVVGSEGDYGVENMTVYYRRDANGETIDGQYEDGSRDDVSYDYGSPLSYNTYRKALEVARRLALADDSAILAICYDERTEDVPA